MKTKSTLVQLLIIILISIPNFLFSQQMGGNGFSIPVHDSIRVLVVYAEVEYPAGTEPAIFSPNNWDITTVPGKTLPPADADDLFDQFIPVDDTLRKFVSGKYQAASLHNYYVLGDYYPEVITVPLSADGSVSVVMDSLNQKEPLNSSLTTANSLTLSDFDKYDLTGSLDGLVKPLGANGKIDILILIWRNSSSFPGGPGCSKGFGLSGAPGGVIKDMAGVEKVMNFNSCGSAGGSVDLILSEYLHGIYGGNNWHTASGAGSHNFIAKPHSYSITGQSNSAMRFVNGFDRWFLDWKNASNDSVISARDFINNEVSSDWSIQNHPSDSNFVLRDFVTTGDAIRIKLPHVENTSSRPQYLWLENRRMNTQYDKWYNSGGCSDDNGVSADGTPGLYAYIQVGREFKSGATIYTNNPSGDPLLASWIYPISAEGNYDFHYLLNDIQNGSNSCDFGNANIPIDKSISLPNPLTGHSDLYNAANTDGSPTLWDNDLQGGFSEVIGGSIVHNLNAFGDWEDAFTDQPGNNKISMGSNPAPVPALTRTFNHGLGTVAQIESYDNTTIWLNGLSIEILLNGSEMFLEITWNNFDIENDVRWCGNIVLQNDTNDPSGTISRINLQTGNTILLDQGTSAQKPNGTLQPDNTYIFADPTILSLESGTITTIESGSELKVENGSTLHLKSGATVIVKGNGKIIIDSNAFICVEPGATIILQDSASELFVDNDGLTGINPLLTLTGNCSNLCEIETQNITAASNGFMTHQNLADAGIDQTICPIVGNNTIGGTPTAVTGVGTGGFTYSWLPATGLDASTIANPTITDSLTVNTVYTVTVIDTNGCIGQDSITLIYNPVTTNALSSTGVTCVGVGVADGTATVTPGCGNPSNFTYLWNDPDAQTTPTATGLEPGDYIVTVTDTATGISTDDTLTVVATILHIPFDFTNPVITSNVTWPAGSLRVKGEVRIEDGGVLNITSSDIEFSYDTIVEVGVPYGRARITIDRGGELRIINSTLTGCGGGIWDGIEVWGNADTTQVFGATNSQGKVFIRTSTIENAFTAIMADRSDLQNVRFINQTGGIVDVGTTTFRNNKRGILLRRYVPNSISQILSCNFIYNRNSLFNYNFSFEEMEFVRLREMSLFSNAKILNNEFFTEQNDFTEQERGVGIKIIDSDVNIDGLGAASTNSNFTGLRAGIDAASVNAFSTLDIRKYDFIDCINGIYVKGIDGAIITLNTFNVPVSSTDTTYGVYMLESSMYAIEENIFNGGGNETVGLYIHNTDLAHDSATNEVYRNNFNNLGFASFGNGVNSNIAFPSKGLTFKCNKYTGNDFDIITTIAPGISVQQGAPGSASSPAGNEFVTSCSITDGELFNASTGVPPNAYDYWHHDAISSPTYAPSTGCFMFGDVFPNDAFIAFNPSGLSGSCVSNDPCIVFPAGCRERLTVQIRNNLANIALLENTLSGGNTNMFLTTIEQSSMSEGQLKNLLKNSAPLSSEVLIAFATSTYSPGVVKDILLSNSPLNDAVLLGLISQNNPLPPGVLEDILEKSAPLSSVVMNALNNLNLPEGIMDNINTNQENESEELSATQTIEATINGLAKENNLSSNKIIRILLRDPSLTATSRFDSIIVVIDSSEKGSTLSSKQIIEALCQSGQYIRALQKITEMEQQSTAMEFCTMQRAFIDMAGMPDKLMTIKTNPGLKATVEAVANNPSFPGSVNARNLLEAAFNKNVAEVFNFPVGNQSSSRVMNNENSELSIINQQQTLDYQLTN